VKVRGDEKIAMAKKRVRVAFFSAPVYDNVKFYMCAMERGVAFSYMMYTAGSNRCSAALHEKIL